MARRTRNKIAQSLPAALRLLPTAITRIASQDPDTRVEEP